MYIRYQHVRNVIVGFAALASLALCGGGAYSMLATRPAPDAPPKVIATSPKPQPADPALAPSPSGGLSDAQIIERAAQPATPSGKIKDAFPGPIKVNIYEDTGDTSWDRVKIDRQRDEVWDEQWVNKGGLWTRDADGKRWDGASWTDGAAAPAEAPDAAKPAAELSELVDLMLTQRATSDKIKDLKRGAGPKINVYDDNKDGKWDRAKVDHDRDDTWDESWTVKGGQVERKKESDGKVYLLKAGAWAPK